MTTPQELLAMTREQLSDALDAYHNALFAYRENLLDAVMAILPGEDTRDAVIEECAKHIESYPATTHGHLISGNPHGTAAQVKLEILSSVRALKGNATPPVERDMALEDAAREIQSVINSVHPSNGLVAREAIRWLTVGQKAIRALKSPP